MGAHVIGHSEGLGTTDLTLDVGLAKSLQDAGWTLGFAEQRSILNGMWSSYGTWRDVDVFAPLLDFVKRSYQLCAVEVYADDSQAKTRFFMNMLSRFINC